MECVFVMWLGLRDLFFFFQAEDGIRDHCVTGVQTCALPISSPCVPPAYTVISKRPPVACLNSSPICLRFLSQTDPIGTSVASLMEVCASGALEHTSAPTAIAQRSNRGVFITA